jgi:hypothetical protein
MNTCWRSAGENKREPELENGREITESGEKEGDYPDSRSKYCAYKSAFFAYNPEKRRTTGRTSTCE